MTIEYKRFLKVYGILLWVLVAIRLFQMGIISEIISLLCLI